MRTRIAAWLFARGWLVLLLAASLLLPPMRSDWEARCGPIKALPVCLPPPGRPMGNNWRGARRMGRCRSATQ